MNRFYVVVDEVVTKTYSVMAESPVAAVYALTGDRRGEDLIFDDPYLEDEEGQGVLDNSEWWVYEEDDNGNITTEYTFDESGYMIWEKGK